VITGRAPLRKRLVRFVRVEQDGNSFSDGKVAHDLRGVLPSGPVTVADDGKDQGGGVQVLGPDDESCLRCPVTVPSVRPPQAARCRLCSHRVALATRDSSKTLSARTAIFDSTGATPPCGQSFPGCVGE
jgi:DNA-directed RNA polymerase subunit RPC12/RpoP